MLEQSAPEGWYGPILEQFLKSCCLWEAHMGLDGISWEGPHWIRERDDQEGAEEVKHC